MIELEGEHYLNGDEASALLGVKLATLYAYVSRGIVRSYKQGIKRQRLYKRSEIEALLRLRPGDEPSSADSKKASEDGDVEAKVEPGDIPLAEDWVPYT